jgi:hypothetical protein
MRAGRLLRDSLGWVVSLGFLVWAARLLVLEGYVYAAPGGFLNGDFPRTATLGSPEFWNGQGIFYGPIFVLEYLFLLAPHRVSFEDFSLLNFVLYGIAFAATWLALVGPRYPRLAAVALGAWLAHHSTLEAFAYTSHLEVLELTCLALALWFARTRHDGAAGSLVGLAVAAKTLPALYLAYLLIGRRWRMALFACAIAGALLLVVCWLQGITPWDGALSLVYQGGNLTKMEYTEYEYSVRADFARIFDAGSGVLTPDQARLAIGLHFAVGALCVIAAGWVVYRVGLWPHTFGLIFGLIAAVMLVASPSAHVHYYIFLMLAWTALLAELVQRPTTPLTVGLWAALLASYVFTGFDQPFFVAQRLFGVGLVVPQHWLPWHLPTLALLLTAFSVAVALLTQAQPLAEPGRTAPFGRRVRSPFDGARVEQSPVSH